MPQTYSEIVAQIETLQAEAEAARVREVPEVIERIREAIAQFGLTAADLGFAGGGRSRSAAKRARQASGANGKAIPTVVARKASKSSRPALKPKSKIPPKYRDGENTWTGRGLKPRWLQAALAKGGKVEDFLIAK